LSPTLGPAPGGGGASRCGCMPSLKSRHTGHECIATELLLKLGLRVLPPTHRSAAVEYVCINCPSPPDVSSRRTGTFIDAGFLRWPNSQMRFVHRAWSPSTGATNDVGRSDHKCCRKAPHPTAHGNRCSVPATGHLGL